MEKVKERASWDGVSFLLRCLFICGPAGSSLLNGLFSSCGVWGLLSTALRLHCWVFIAEWAFLQLRWVGATLHCSASSLLSGLFSSCGEWGPLSTALRGLLVAVASLVMERALQGAWDSVVVARGLSSCNSRALEHRLSSRGAWLSCSRACRIFPDQGSNPWLLHQLVDSLPPSHQWSSEIVFLVFPRSLYLFPWPSFSHSILPSCSQCIWFNTIKNNNARATPSNSQDWLCNDFVLGTLLNVSGTSSHSVLTVCMSMAKERWTIWKFDLDLCQHPLLFLCGGKIRVSHAPVGACIPRRTYRGPLCVVIP